MPAEKAGWVWSPTKALRVFRKQGLSIRDLDNALLGAGLRVRCANWFLTDRPGGPSASSLREVVKACGLSEEPFDEVFQKFFDRRG